ncbi:sprouty-related, EVH1 domain-containing protein 3 isoform X5 [Pongo abelii]|uniref:sprouty-related, EVH1 domain-containing protein 3 isoform X5 n=1 Tax=Pongo abelii TaxID=9601 RepID=UPI0030045490
MAQMGGKVGDPLWILRKWGLGGCSLELVPGSRTQQASKPASLLPLPQAAPSPPHPSSRFPFPPPSPRLPVPVSSAAGASQGAGTKRRRRRPRRRRSEPGRSLAGRYMVRVRAVVMARDDSSGGWLPVGGGGLSQVSVCRVRGARPEGGARQGHYVIHGERLRDQKTTLECTLKPGLVYNKVNPIFHHWSLGDCKFGLTFQSPAEADEFQKSLLAALAALGRGSLTPSSSSSSSSPSQDTAETPCPLTILVPLSKPSQSASNLIPSKLISQLDHLNSFSLSTPSLLPPHIARGFLSTAESDHAPPTLRTLPGLQLTQVKDRVLTVAYEIPCHVALCVWPPRLLGFSHTASSLLF